MYVINNNKISKILANGIINNYNIANADSDSIGNPIKIFNNGILLTNTAELYMIHNNYAQKLLPLYSASVNLDSTHSDLSIHDAKELVLDELDYFDTNDKKNN